jgi:transposase InsO family protein
MNMAYTNNPERPHVRMEAVKLVRLGWSVRKVARHFGFTHSAVVKWVKRAPCDRRARIIPTASSRPRHHPDELVPETVETIIAYRKKYERGAEVLQELMRRDGIFVSLSSVKRTLKRNELTYPSKWKKWHQYPPRPIPATPGILVEIDTIHVGAPEERLYLYTLLDVCSRWGHAIPSLRINTHRSLRFVDEAKVISPFSFQTLQSDHGSEFSTWFTKRITERGLSHRHSRIRTPNDNAHLERFNRTIQDECINRLPRNFRIWQNEIPEYLDWYNQKRPHLGLELKTPTQKIVEILTPGSKLLT